MDNSLRKKIHRIAASYLGALRGCHGIDHTLRVRENAFTLARSYVNIDLCLLETSAYLHDIGRGAEREGPHGEISAELAAIHLQELGFAPSDISAVADAIREHPYSSGSIPSTFMGKLLQDADRLDALGAIGIARVFTEGRGLLLYDPDDPLAARRELDDSRFTIDHFYRKIAVLDRTLHTPEARKIAERRKAFLISFLDEFALEIGASGSRFIS